MMFLGIRKKYWICLIITAVIGGSTIFANISSVFGWKAIEYLGPGVDALKPKLENAPDETNIFRVNKSSMIETIMALDGIHNVALNYDLPSGIRAEVNRFRPLAMLASDDLYGIDRFCRVIPYDTTWESKDMPIITGLNTQRQFNQPDDFRMADVIHGLEEIKENSPELFAQIAEIDLSSKIYLEISLTTGHESYLAISEDLADQLYKLHLFRETGLGAQGGQFNLQYAGLVIKK
ncbi:MAG: hypothetical protein ABIE07_00065 [Candidatus Zixiibacteriota bacterium]